MDISDKISKRLNLIIDTLEKHGMLTCKEKLDVDHIINPQLYGIKDGYSFVRHSKEYMPSGKVVHLYPCIDYTSYKHQMQYKRHLLEYKEIWTWKGDLDTGEWVKNEGIEYDTKKFEEMYSALNFLLKERKEDITKPYHESELLKWFSQQSGGNWKYNG